MTCAAMFTGVAVLAQPVEQSDAPKTAEEQCQLGIRYLLGTDGVDRDVAEAVNWFRKAAEQGHPGGQHELGFRYRYGEGVPQDTKEAVKWFRSAAEQGLAPAQCELGLCYLHGIGVPKDFEKSVEWFRKAAEQGFAPGQHELGFRYYHGDGVPQNRVEAYGWIRKAAEQDFLPSMHELGLCYLRGTGVVQDEAEAMKWLHKAADQGDIRTLDFFASRYLRGIGVPQDVAEAMKWYRKLADAEQEHPVERQRLNARLLLGTRYFEGNGVPQDFVEAKKWLRKVAEEQPGNTNVRNMLSKCYLYSLEDAGISDEDKVEAENWLRGAANRGQTEAIRWLRKVVAEQNDSVPVHTEPLLPKIAIVPGGDPKPNALLALTEAKLFENQEIELLDRTEIDKVLAEQKLSGMFGAAHAIALGQILKTDLFAVLETKSVVIFDAHTGLRFVDETLPAALEDAVKTAADAVKTAVEKRQKLADGTLVTFGVAEVRNVDFPVSRDAWCRAVAGMLERSLLHRGGAVLERSRLQHVNRERQLPGDATNNLLASMKLIDIDFTRAESLQSFKMTARIGNARFMVEGAFENPLDAVHQLTEQLLEIKNVLGSDRKAEAAKFATEARVLETIGTWDEIVEKYESAIGLDPENLEPTKQYFAWLSKRVNYRLRDWEGLNGYEHAWMTNPINAETMGHNVHSAFRLEALLASLPFDDQQYQIYEKDFADIRFKLAMLAEHRHPDFQDKVRTLNRQALDRWFNARYRVSLNCVVDQETFRNYLRIIGSGSPNPHETTDLAAPYAEIIEKTLLLSREYEMTPENKRNWNYVLVRFSQAFQVFRAKGNAGTRSGHAATMFEHALVLMEQDSQYQPQIQAWIARNRPVVATTEQGLAPFDWTCWSADVGQLETYRHKLKSYIATFPKELSYFDSECLYDELAAIFRKEHLRNGQYPFNATVSRHLAEMFELADSRNEYARSAVDLYISLTHHTLLDNQADADRTEYIKLKEQFHPMFLRQIALGERLAPYDARRNLENYESIIQQSKKSPKIAEVSRPWTSEVNLFPRNEGYEPWGRPTLRGNLLFSPLFVRNGTYGDKRCLGSINLETLEKQYIPLPTESWSASSVTYIDEENIYFNTFSDSRSVVDENGQRQYLHDAMGLFVHPLDGSDPWTLTTDDGLPGNTVYVFGRLGDHCYARVGIDWIIRIDVKTRQWEQLSSSRAKEGKTPFVNGKQLRQFNTLYDSKRERILLHDKSDGVERRAAFWAIEKDGTFVLLTRGNPNNYVKDMIRFGDKLLERINDGVQLLQFNPTNGEKYVYDEETSTLFPADYSDFSEYNGCVWNGYYWGGGGDKWWRRRFDTGSKRELLAKPEAATPFEGKNQDYWYPTFCTPAPNGKGLIVARGREIILLRFENPSTDISEQ